MKRIIQVLMVDDHPLIVEGYINIISEIKEFRNQIKFKIANSLKDGYGEIAANKDRKESFDLIFLDLNLPVYNEKKMFSGEDLALMVRENSPQTKIIFLTNQENDFRLSNLIFRINPEGLLIKSEVGSAEIVKAFTMVLKGKNFYSKKAERNLKVDPDNYTRLDKFDRQILYYLSNGFKTKELPCLVPLSLASIEKRKRIMKDILGLDKVGDLVLINKARDMGFL